MLKSSKIDCDLTSTFIQHGESHASRPLLIAYLYQSPFVHSTEDEKWVRRPVHVGYLVQAGVELHDLQGAHVSHHQPVLHTGSLRRTTEETSHEKIKLWELNQSLKYNFSRFYKARTIKPDINKYHSNISQSLTKYFPSGETLQSWLDCLKTSEKFILRSQLFLHEKITQLSSH